ncbi:amino acid adenylation domain-containing protein [Enterovibrio calviensis]|uniref:non-ribosomal peptide synthetase n=1 Tax=Enterovibrio calviensis TaxID=91359 RepID=UPI003737032C
MTSKIDKFALAKRFLQLGDIEQVKFIRLLDEKGLDFEKLPIVSSSDRMTFPLSPAQKRMWDIYLLDPANSAYHMSGVFRMTGEFDVERFERALQQATNKHAALRTQFTMHEGKEPVQTIALNPAIAMARIDVSDWSALAIDEERHEFLLRPFDLRYQLPVRFQCLALGENTYQIHIVMHHIVSDGWSVGVLMEDVLSAYQGVTLSPPSIQYGDYAVWQHAILRAGKGDAQLAYWQDKLGHIQPPKLFQWVKDVAPNQRREAASLSRPVPDDIAASIKHLARQIGVTSASVWLGLWQCALAMKTRTSDISVGMPMANRTRQETTDVVGFFVNTMVIKQNVTAEKTLKNVIKDAHSNVMASQERQLLPFDQIVEHVLDKRAPGETPLFQVLFNHQVSHALLTGFSDDLTIAPVPAQGTYALFDVALDVRETAKGTSVVLTYASDRIATAEMHKLNGMLWAMLARLETLLPMPVAQLPRLNEDESLTLDALSLPFGAEKGDCEWSYVPVTTLFDRQADERPDAIAIKHGTSTYTYSELREASNHLANYLQNKGVKKDQAVGVLFDRGCDMIVAMIAVMKAGAAFLPLDPDYPTERLAYMVKDARAQFVMTASSVLERWGEVKACMAEHAVVALAPRISAFKNLRAARQKPIDWSSGVLEEQLAYIIYTSGSTGKPKGVAIDHHGLSMHVQTIGKKYGMTPEDTELHFASISFDGAVERWTVPLSFGSRLIIRDQHLWSAEQTCEVLKREAVTIACFPPSYVAPLLDWIEAYSLTLPVRSWTLGGEAFTRETFDRLQRVVSPPRIINGYGPTETVVTPMIWRAYPDDALTSAYAPIGEPVGERRLYVLDTQLNRVPLGEEGELYIGDEIGLARGYLFQSSLTAERFIPDPFKADGGRMYRTGDLVRWREDGAMEYLGRVDHQIKIRGFRVELGEIESGLQQLSGAESCVVAHHIQGKLHLIGYMKTQENHDLVARDVLLALATHVPEYMIPSQLVMLDDFPLTPAGKIDRSAFSAPQLQAQHEAHYEAPQSDAEKTIAEVWRSVLNTENVGVNDNFFSLGGDSILCLQLISQLKQKGYELTPKHVFMTPVLKDLAQQLTHVQAIESRVLPTEPFGLMPIQAHFFAQDYANPHHVNQHVCLALKQTLDVSALEAALKALIIHHPSLRLAFQQTEGVWQQAYSEPNVASVLWQTRLTTEDEFEAFSSEIQTRLDVHAGHLFQAGYAQFDNEPDRLLIVIHHLAVDGVSWRVLVDDLWNAYQQVLKGDAIRLPLNDATLDLAVDALATWKQTQNSDEAMRFWGQQTQNNDQPTVTFAERSRLAVELDAESTEKLLKHHDIQSVLLAALADVLLDEHLDATTILMEGHGREASVFGDLDLSRLVGWMTSVYPFKLYNKDNAEKIKTRLGFIKADGGISFGAFMSDGLREDEHLASQQQEGSGAVLTFNYLGQYASNQYAHWCDVIDAGGPAQDHANTMLTPLVVNSQVMKGRLTMDWEYARSQFTEEDVATLASRYIASLKVRVNALAMTASTHPDQRLIEQLNGDVKDKTPVFCIHPVTGRVTGYQKLAAALEGQRTVLGVQSKSMVVPNQFDGELCQMAGCYYASIKERQPAGPYTLIGWSLGGALCLDVARRLEKNGDVVEGIYLLDCYVPGTEVADDQWSSPSSKIKLLTHLELLLGDLSQTQKEGCIEAFNRHKPHQWPRVFEDWLSRYAFERHVAENARQMLYSWAVEQHLRVLCDGYKLPGISSPIHAWWAGDPQGRSVLLNELFGKKNALSSSQTSATDHLGIVQDVTTIAQLKERLILPAI